MLNIIFTILFAIEAILKVIGMGIKEFSKDKFNLFDAFVVAISLVRLYEVIVLGGVIYERWRRCG